MAGNRFLAKGTFTPTAASEFKAVWTGAEAGEDSSGNANYFIPDAVLPGWTHMSVYLENLAATTGSLSSAEDLKIGTALRKNDGTWKESGGTKVEVSLVAAGTTESMNIATVGSTYGPRSVNWAVKNADEPTCSLDAEGFVFYITGDAGVTATVQITVILTRAGA